MASFIFCKNFVDIIYENFHAHARRLYVAAAYLFLNYKFILVWKMPFSDWWDTKLLQSITEFTLCFLYRLNESFWKIHGIAWISSDFYTTDQSNQVKISCEIMRCQGYFFKNALGTKLANLVIILQYLIFDCHHQHFVMTTLTHLFSCYNKKGMVKNTVMKTSKPQ